MPRIVLSSLYVLAPLIVMRAQSSSYYLVFPNRGPEGHQLVSQWVLESDLGTLVQSLCSWLLSWVAPLPPTVAT